MTTATPVAPPARALEQSPLAEFHREHRAHMFAFAGWEMPRDYGSILDEHRAVRTSVGLFDVSHMGILTVEGDHAAALLARRTTANVPRMTPGQCRYAFWLNADGMILDDLLITRLDDGQTGPPRFVVVPNASRAERILDLLLQHRLPDTNVARHNHQVAILAVQGPRSRELLERLFRVSLAALKFYTARAFPRAGTGAEPGRDGLQFPAELGNELWISRTGYTGELGYELFVPGGQAVAIAQELVRAGAAPCGLVARDMLRLEKGYLLSGQDFQLDRTPLEAGQDRFVELDHPFVGEPALIAQRDHGLVQRLTGIEVDESGAIPRHGSQLFAGEQPIGTASSGGLSPILGRGIALAYLPVALTAPGTRLSVGIRDRKVPAHVAALPFVPAKRPPT